MRERSLEDQILWRTETGNIRQHSKMGSRPGNIKRLHEENEQVPHNKMHKCFTGLVSGDATHEHSC
jgi:hypothetical protein